MMKSAKQSLGRIVALTLLPLAFSVFIAGIDSGLVVLWPSFAALVVVLLLRNAMIGLFTGAVCGAILIADGEALLALRVLGLDLLLPVFSSPWKVSAILFTLILGGFVALVEAGGGLQGLIKRLLGNDRAPARRMQFTVFGFGLLVFFDGLANTMLIGRLLRSAADRCGVSREKLAYLADTTGSAVACLAFISTWIAFQLSMIRAGFEAVGQEVSAYALFFKSLPANFYCWFALVLAAVSIWRDYNPGPMGAFERVAREKQSPSPDGVSTITVKANHWLMAIVPILVLTLSIPVLTYFIGTEALWPFSFEKFALAYAVAESAVPQILVASSLLATLVAAFAWFLGSDKKGKAAFTGASRHFFGGVRDLLGPIAVLFTAWMLGAAISELGASDFLAQLLQGRIVPGFLPAAIFVMGALISFSTGTSWGTIGVLMPLAIPVIFALTSDFSSVDRESLIVASIGAVFSGAVFGDHCSPFSDTTIVSSIASGVEPLDHVRTQMPFALIAAVIALVVGFVPLGFGLPSWVCLLAGLGFIGVLGIYQPGTVRRSVV